MPLFNAHLFGSAAAANAAAEILTAAANLPTFDVLTNQYCQPAQYQDYWYIVADSFTEEILGASKEIEVLPPVIEEEL